MSEKILVIDDDEEFANLLGLLLSKRGYETKVCYDGAEGIEAAKGFMPAVILQDYMLPEVYGINLLRGLKEACPAAHLIIITAKGDEETAVELMKSGASDYLKKPFESEKLITTIENVLKLRSSEVELDRLNREILQHNREFMALSAISKALTSDNPLSERCQSAVSVILHATGADLVLLFKAREDGKTLKLLAYEAPGLDFAPREGYQLPREVGIISYVAEIRKPATVSDFRLEKRFKVHEEATKHGLTSALAVPLMVGESLKGVLGISTKAPRTFTSFDIKLMNNFAGQFAMAVENDRLSKILGNFQKQWQVMFDAVPDRMTVQDADHIIIMANKVAADTAGVEVKDLIGQKCCWAFHNQKEPIQGCPVSEVLNTGKAVHKRLKAGSPAQAFDVSAYPIFDDDGNVALVVEYAKAAV